MSINFNGVALSDNCDGVRFNGSPVEIVRFNGVEVWNCILSGCPGPPTDLAVEVRPASLYLSWSAVANAASYNVYNAVGDVLILNTTDLFYEFTAGNSGEHYTFYVTSLPIDTDNCSESDRSTEAEEDFPLLCPVAPTATSTVASTSITVSWNAVQYASDYAVYLIDDTLLQDTITDLHYSFTTGTPGTNYSFYVIAHPVNTGCSDSPPSNTVSEDFPTPVEPNCPLTPTGLTATAGAPGSDNIYLNWDDMQYADSYVVYIDGSSVGTTIGSEYYYTTGVGGQTYLFKVSSLSNDFECTETAPSTEVSAVYPDEPAAECPSAPTNFVATNASTTITCSWDNMAFAGSYNVYSNGALLTNTDNTSYTFSGNYETTYTLYTTSVSTDPGCPSESAPSNTDSVTLPSPPVGIPNPPTSITASNCTDTTSIIIAWEGEGPNFRLKGNNTIIYEGPLKFLDHLTFEGVSIDYSVACYNTAGESAYINDIGTSKPGEISTASASLVGDDILFTWATSGGADSYTTTLDGGLEDCGIGTSRNFSGPFAPGSTILLEVTPHGEAFCTSCTNTTEQAIVIIPNNPPPSGSEEFFSDDTFTVPDGVTSLTITCVGGGGGGGSGQGGSTGNLGSTGDTGDGGQGGKAGDNNTGTISVSSGEVININVGDGGIGGYYSDGGSGDCNVTGDEGNNGGPGITSSVKTIAAFGGAGGSGGTTEGGAPATPGESSSQGTGGIAGANGGADAGRGEDGGNASGQGAGGGGSGGGGRGNSTCDDAGRSGTGGDGTSGYVLIEWG